LTGIARRWAPCALAAAALVIAPGGARAGAFIFAGEANGIDVVAHPVGYDGSGATLTVDVCIDPTSVNADEMEPAVQSAIATWNALAATTANLASGAANELASNEVDFESVLLHELGHCIGLAHPNLASEAGVSPANADHTRSTAGPDASYDLGAGVDGIEGSADDARGDDVNLHWFEIGVNDPFQSSASVFDGSTMSRLLSDLPGGATYAANGDRQVGAALGYAASEAVMQQGTSSDEAQRALVQDDVSTIRFAMSGIDEVQGNADDYGFGLAYVGRTSSCDIVIDFDETQTGFAVCFVSGVFLDDPPPGPPTSTDHVAITQGEIFFNPGFNWFFGALCGDGVIGGAEACDDGGTTPGDGCDEACAIEAGYGCSGTPSVCTTSCGDGIVAGGEACDDGGAAPGDGCDGSCAIESGFTCGGSPSTCTTTCGDGMVAGAETCDDGGTSPGDGCDAVCEIEAGYGCGGAPSTCTTTCGDGIIAGEEACDDGGTSPGDGCDAVCAVEPGYVCVGMPSACTIVSSVPAMGRGGLGLLVLGAAVLCASAVRGRVPS
jgi:cysteine-rich repeat protein